MSPTISAAIKANCNNNNNNVSVKKILAERNETLDVVKPNSVIRRSSNFDSKVVKFSGFDACYGENVEKGLVGKSSLQPYDPIKNYLSPRPKFLRYNPDRRRKTLNLRESVEDCVKSSSSFDVGNGNGNGELPSSGLELESGSGVGSSDSADSCLKKKFEEESVNETEKGGEGEDEEIGEEEEMTEFGEDNCRSLNAILKFVFVVLAVILSTQAICSMNSPDNLHAKESVWGNSNWYSKVYGSASSNVSEVVYGVMREGDLLVERLKVGDAYRDHKGVISVKSTEELVEIQDELMDEVENDETYLKYQESAEKLPVQEIVKSEVVDISNVKEYSEDGLVEDKEIKAGEVVDIGSGDVSKEVHDFNQDALIEGQEIKVNEVLEVGNVEVEIEVHDIDQEDGVLIEDCDFAGSENKFQVTADADFEMEENMEEVMENGAVDDIKSTSSNVLVKSATFDPTLAVLIGVPILVSMFFGVIYHSMRKPFFLASTKVAKQIIVAEKKEIKAPEPAPTPSSLHLCNQESLQRDVYKEISHATYAPSVELLSEFVFGEEVTSSVRNYNNISAEANASNSFIRTTTVSIDQTKLSHMEMSAGDSHTVKKQRHKNAEVSSTVTPSSVRRSSRLQNRSIMSP
uniref:uncharacterized protein LOC122588923 n=1 Tax=Erigeron canadensis TaxID=72917 RepID=UPI001CB8C33C|nr:uncharacterized protein LOC122588923 [Erigeron canadensis]